MGLIIQYLVETASIEYKLSWVIGAIFAVTNNYIGLKLYVFKKK
jgi:putative flippase GtrA